MLQSTACLAAQFGWFWLIEPSPAVVVDSSNFLCCAETFAMAGKAKLAAAAAEVVEATVAQAAATTEAAREAATGGKNAAAVSMEAIKQLLLRFMTSVTSST